MNNFCENKERIHLFDNVRFVLILLVVIGHFADVYASKSAICRSIYLCIYAFHMPLFLFLSGLFYKSKNILPKVLGFVAVGFLYKIVVFLEQLILYDKASFLLLSDATMPWYMFVLAIYLAVSYGLRNVDKRYILIGSIILACFSGYDASIGDYLYLSRAIVFYPCFVLGQMIDKDTIIDVTSKKSWKLVSIIILAVWVFLCFARLENWYAYRALFTGRNPFKVNEMFAEWGCIYRLFSYFITLVTSFSVLCLVPRRKIRGITVFGERTLQVYFWHRPVLIALSYFGVASALSTSAKGKMIWLMLSVVTTFVLSLKPCGFLVNQVFELSKKCVHEGGTHE